MEPTNSQSLLPAANKSTGKTVAIILLLLVVGLLVGSTVYFYNEQQKTKRSEAAAKAQLAEAEQKLKVARDMQRKKDLALLANVIRDYKKAKGSYYTTEGTQSKVIFETELSPKIQEFTEPTTGKPYGYEAIAAVHTPSPPQLGVIQYQWLGKCAADGDFEDTTSNAFAAIRTVLESGATHCVDM